MKLRLNNMLMVLLIIMETFVLLGEVMMMIWVYICIFVVDVKSELQGEMHSVR